MTDLVLSQVEPAQQRYRCEMKGAIAVAKIMAGGAWTWGSPAERAQLGASPFNYKSPFTHFTLLSWHPLALPLELDLHIEVICSIDAASFTI